MKIAISGATGYIAKNLVWELQAEHHQIVPITRDILNNVDQLTGLLSDTDVVINLAGAPILQRWNKANMEEIYKSRVETTQNIVQAINRLSANNKPGTFISASAIGIYTPGEVHNEESNSFSKG